MASVTTGEYSQLEESGGSDWSVSFQYNKVDDRVLYMGNPATREVLGYLQHMATVSVAHDAFVQPTMPSGSLSDDIEAIVTDIKGLFNNGDGEQFAACSFLVSRGHSTQHVVASLKELHTIIADVWATESPTLGLHLSKDIYGDYDAFIVINTTLYTRVARRNLMAVENAAALVIAGLDIGLLLNLG